MAPEPNTIKDAIKKLSQKKEVVSEEALSVKKEIEEAKKYGLNPHDLSRHLDKKNSLIEEFDQSIKILSSIFRKSNFDDLVLFIASPGKLFTLNLFIGVVRGVGFAIGVLLVILALLYPLVGSSSSSINDFIQQFLSK